MEKYGKMGYNQGDMKPEVSDYQPKISEFAGEQPGKTVDYIPRRDKTQNAVASKLKSQDYRGRYE